MRPVVSPVVGAALRAVFAGILLLRRPKPIHARGVVLRGSISWRPRRGRSGIPWVDDAPDGPVPVVARTSRSVGLPPPLPDVVGLALRVDAPGTAAGFADIELASTGFGVPSRFWVSPHRSPSRARLGTLFPYRGMLGPVLLCARTIAPRDLPVGVDELALRLARDPWRLTLYWATPAGKWHPFADIELTRPGGAGDPPDALLRFDAVEHPLPSAGTYAWTAAVRQPSYRLARRHPRATAPT